VNAVSGMFRFDFLSLLIGGLVAFFTLTTLVYSLGFMRGRARLGEYYLFILLTFGASLGAVFSRSLIVFLVFWGFLGLLLYLLIAMGTRKRTPFTAKKAFIIIGGTDALMLFGLALVWRLEGAPNVFSLNIDSTHLSLDSPAAWIAYLCLAAGALAKAGAMPFHTWVPDCAEDAPTPVAAFLPASLDKLLGIYFLVRLSLDSTRSVRSATWCWGSERVHPSELPAACFT
jgi:NADH:ubiquinone oxidoreductase subunit 5 (subunit L)/multisubunit Na+/H+ antiporter MnhA subunit